MLGSKDNVSSVLMDVVLKIEDSFAARNIESAVDQAELWLDQDLEDTIYEVLQVIISLYRNYSLE